MKDVRCYTWGDQRSTFVSGGQTASLLSSPMETRVSGLDPCLWQYSSSLSLSLLGWGVSHTHTHTRTAIFGSAAILGFARGFGFWFS